MKVFVTGSSGFLGARFLRKLLAEHCDVTILMRPDHHTWRIDDLLGKVRVLNGDFAHPKELVESVQGLSCDMFAHFAWAGVAGAHRFDMEQYEINVPATIAALEMARAMGAKTFMSFGSQSEYGRAQGLVGEDVTVAPETHYSKAKNIARMITMDYCAATEMRPVWFRIFPVYGPGETEPWLIPSLVKSLESGQAFPMTECLQVRDYLYVDDAADAFYAVLKHPTASGIFNVASGKGVVLRTLVEAVRDIVAPDTELQFGELPFRQDQSMEIIGDISRIRDTVGWSPQVDLENGLHKTVEHLSHDGA